VPTTGSGGLSVAFAPGLSPATIAAFPVPAHQTDVPTSRILCCRHHRRTHPRASPSPAAAVCCLSMLLSLCRLRHRLAGGDAGDPFLGPAPSAGTRLQHRPAGERSLPVRVHPGTRGGRGPASPDGSRGRVRRPDSEDAHGARCLAGCVRRAGRAEPCPRPARAGASLSSF